MKIIKQNDYFVISTENISLQICRDTGRQEKVKVFVNGKEHTWTDVRGDTEIKDDLARRYFNSGDVINVKMSTEESQDILFITKRYRDAEWRLEERYSEYKGFLHWGARIIPETKTFRSVSVNWKLPWPDHLYPFQVWAATHNMPRGVCESAEERFEYGEVTAGIAIPMGVFYNSRENWGIAVCKPFELRTPQFGIVSGYRTPFMQITFNNLALYENHIAEASFYLWGTEGCWRPALGKVFTEYKKYFVSKSKLLPRLWGGHNCGRYNQKEEDVKTGAKYGEKWCEIHAHFPLYGQYDEQQESWTSIEYAWHKLPKDKSLPYSKGKKTKKECECSVETVCATIRLLNKYGIAAMPYVQVSGDANPEIADRFPEDRIKDIHGKYIGWHENGTSFLWQMNASQESGFGKHLDKMIEGVINKYKGIKGVFVDQACYNFIDTAHFDGISAVDNKPVNMTAFNFAPRLAMLSKRIHPDGAIMANGPSGIEIMEHIDGFMAEGTEKWLCDHFQYLGLAKPMYCLLYKHNRRNVEMMFQYCLIYGAGYTANQWASLYGDIYEAYMPIIDMLAERVWVFEPNPLLLPTGFEGNIFRSKNNDILVTIVKNIASAITDKEEVVTVSVRTHDINKVKKAQWYNAGCKKSIQPEWEMKNGKASVYIPANKITAGILKLTRNHYERK